MYKEQNILLENVEKILWHIFYTSVAWLLDSPFYNDVKEPCEN